VAKYRHHCPHLYYY